jgi:pimeloyl-ACP methyl ester carboxylesterase
MTIDTAIAARDDATAPAAPSLPVFNGRRIVVGGVSLNVVVEGQGPDVMLIHGFPDSHQVWRKQIPALVAAGYRVIAPDLRGFGASDMPADVASYAVEHVVADLVGVLDALGVAKVRLVGHDWGAMIGWLLAIAHPTRVERYAALSVGHPNAYSRGGLMQKLKGYYILVIQARGFAEWLMRLGGWWFFRLMTRYAAELPVWKAEMGRPGRLRAALGLYRANLWLVLPQKYPRVTVPVLGVWSSDDLFLCERQMLRSADCVSAAWRYERLDGVNHWMPLAAPDRINALLLDFLR